jgi:DNA-binding transcriptional LysR family regulator
MAELRRLRYFLAVAAERNFTRAAEQLHVAQPALSRQVRELERELGVELLRRTTRAVELTEAGEQLVARGPAVLAAADQLWRTVRAYGEGELGTITLGYGPSASYETAPRLLAEVAERAPDLRVDTRVLAAHEILDAVARRGLNAGLVRCPPERTEGVEAVTIRHEPRACSCPPIIPWPPQRRWVSPTSLTGPCCCTVARRTRATTTRSSTSTARPAWSPRSACAR